MTPVSTAVETGPGWHFDADLRPHLHDEAAFRAAHAHEPALEAIIALWSGRPARAQALLGDLLREDPTSWRLSALHLDCLRDQGLHDEATAGYRTLLERAPRRALPTLTQHLGKAQLAAGAYDAAAASFHEALRARLLQGERALVASSRAAFHHAINRHSEALMDTSENHSFEPAERPRRHPGTSEGTATFVESAIGQSEPHGGHPGAHVVLENETAKVVAFEFSTGDELKEHAAHHPVIIQILRGRVRFTLPDRELDLTPGSLLHLTPQLRHAVTAVEPTTLTVTMLLPHA